MLIDYDLETDIRYLQGVKAGHDFVLNEIMPMLVHGTQQKGWSMGLLEEYDSEYIEPIIGDKIKAIVYTLELNLLTTEQISTALNVSLNSVLAVQKILQISLTS